jgi:hypothetical protein
MAATFWHHKGSLYILLPVYHPSKKSKIGDHSCPGSTEPYFEDVQVDSTIPMLVKGELSHIQSMRDADAVGNFNPLHADLKLARRSVL